MKNNPLQENPQKISLGTLNKILLGLLGSSHLVDKWWASPNRAFEMDTPAYVYSQYPEHVAKYILQQI